MAKDGERQREGGMHPVKLLLLALSTTKFRITFHVDDGNSAVSWLLEMLSTCRVRAEVTEYGSSFSTPLSLLKLTSRTMMLLEYTSSSGRPPENELCERLTRNRLVRPAR
jgi:hypothetical protein